MEQFLRKFCDRLLFDLAYAYKNNCNMSITSYINEKEAI